MVEKLMIDHLVHWAKIFKMDGFRFDLMGFHTVDNMKNIRAAVRKKKIFFSLLLSFSFFSENISTFKIFQKKKKS